MDTAEFTVCVFTWNLSVEHSKLYYVQTKYILYSTSLKPVRCYMNVCIVKHSTDLCITVSEGEEVMKRLCNHSHNLINKFNKASPKKTLSIYFISFAVMEMLSGVKSSQGWLWRDWLVCHNWLARLQKTIAHTYKKKTEKTKETIRQTFLNNPESFVCYFQYISLHQAAIISNIEHVISDL